MKLQTNKCIGRTRLNGTAQTNRFSALKSVQCSYSAHCLEVGTSLISRFIACKLVQRSLVTFPDRPLGQYSAAWMAIMWTTKTTKVWKGQIIIWGDNHSLWIIMRSLAKGPTVCIMIVVLILARQDITWKQNQIKP